MHSDIRQFKHLRTKEELNSLYLKLIQSGVKKSFRSIMIVSCNEKEGASTVAVNLAEAFASKSGENVLLVDSNLHSPSLAEFFGVKNSEGFSDIVSRKMDVRAAIQETGIENLSLLTAGSNPEQSFKVFNSEELSHVLEKLNSMFRFIILDSAPVIPYADALLLAPRIDIVLLVIEAEKTRWEVAQEAVNKLSDVGVPVSGTILNKKKHSIPSFIYKRL